MGAIDRVEVLKDGASAIYGSDAIAGVVNIILRKDYNGTEANLYYNNTFDTDSRIVNGSLTTGFSNERGSAVITVETYKQNPMMATDRDYSSSADQRSRGGGDVRVSPGLRGTVYAMPGQVLPGVFLANGQPATFAAIPAGQTGDGLTPADFGATAGVVDLLDQNLYQTTVPARDTLNVMGVFDYRLNDDITFFGQVAYSHTESYATIYNGTDVYLGQLVVPAANPYNPFGVDVRVEKNLTLEMGASKHYNDYDDYGLVGGLRGPLPGGWEWEAAYSRGRSTANSPFDLYNRNRGDSNVLSTDPAVAYNWFGDAAAGEVNSAAKIDNLRGYQEGKGVGTLSMVDATARGPLFELFGNQVQAAIGAEYRRDDYQQSYVSNASLPSSTFQGVIQQQSRKTQSVFAEMEVPLVTSAQGVPFVRHLELSFAGRYEDLDEYGTTADPRIGVRWQVVPSLLLRASWGTSFRAPTADQVGSSPSIATRTVADPLRGNQVYAFMTYESSNLGLNPETSDNFSAGLIFEPSALAGLSVSLDYYSIDYEDKFTYLFPENAVRYPEAFSRYVTRATPTPQDIALGYAGQITSMQLGYVNLSGTKVSGIDFDLSYGWETALGRFTYSLLGTRTMKYDELVAPGSPAVRRLGDYTYPKKWQGNTSLFLNRGNLDAGVTFRYVHSYEFTGVGLFDPPRRIDAIEEFDVQASYRFPGEIRFTTGVINLFDRDPPFFPAPVYYVGNFGYDNTLTSPRGATYYMSIRKSF
jgi:outer membrane receptor protein involved in Fe transport